MVPVWPPPRIGVLIENVVDMSRSSIPENGADRAAANDWMMRRPNDLSVSVGKAREKIRVSDFRDLFWILSEDSQILCR